MNYKEWYSTHYESKLMGRYVNLNHIYPLLKSDDDFLEISTEGFSELGKDIPLVKIGNGKQIVLAWSQMHGNESTTTKAIFDFIKFISQKDFFQNEIKEFLSAYTFFILPILNPDGAELYTRENANMIDLNRDAQDLSQSESRTLRNVFSRVKPDLCLNLHDQRSIYGLNNGLSASVSFLAPSANKERSLTPAREVAMSHIVRLHKMLQDLIPGKIGRYDDSFNANCVGDTFQMLGVPTLLFEAGHLNSDYQRENTRTLIYYALLELFGFNDDEEVFGDFSCYSKIPRNQVNYYDIIIRDALLANVNKVVDIAIQYSEELKQGKVHFNAIVVEIGNCDLKHGHREIKLDGRTILINSQENIEVGQNVFNIVDKMGKSVVNLLKN